MSDKKIFRAFCCSLAVVFFFQSLGATAASAAQSASEYDEFDKELNDLDSKIQDHLKRAREAAFWNQEHTVAQPGQTTVSKPSSNTTPTRSGTVVTPQSSNLAPKNKTVSTTAATPPAETRPTPVQPVSSAPATTAVPTRRPIPQAASVPSPAPAPAAAASPVRSSGTAVSSGPSTNISPARRPATETAPVVRTVSAPTPPVRSSAPAPITVAPSVSRPAPAAAVSAPRSSEPAPDAKEILNQNYQDMDAVDREIASRTHVSGSYRAAFGVGRNRNFSINDSNPDLQDRDFHYLFGDRQYNTFDPAINSHYRVDIDSQVTKTDSVFVQMVADPWSYVGRTSEIQTTNPGNSDGFRIQQKYWGANNSIVPQQLRSRARNTFALPELEANSGHTQAFTTTGHPDYGTRYFVPEQDIDYEFRPLRKAWWDHQGDIWHVRLFALADQNQVMTTDDPLHLSNNKDFWQHSPWLEDWRPIQTFSVAPSPTIKHGGYSDEEAFYAKDSEGNYMTLLRGGAVEADFGRTYVGMMIASRYGLWDDYQDIDNIPGVVRIKHQVTEPWMLGATYTYRVGMIDREPDAYNQVLAIDTKYATNSEDFLYGEIAGSRNSIDRLSSFEIAYEGMAYKTGFVAHTGNTQSGITQWHGDYTWLDTDFKETLSHYATLRDDEFWGTHITWAKIPPDVDPFKIGTGVDYGRNSARLNIASSFPDKGVDNIFDVRHVRDSDSMSFIENVIRDETTWKFAPDWTFKNFMRFHILPRTLSDVEPFMNSYRPPSWDDPALSDTKLENTLIDAGLNANRRSFGQGLQWEPTPQWTASGTFEISNDIPDYPRGVMDYTYVNTTIRDPRNPNWYLDRLQSGLYRQDIFGLPSYDYFSIVKERVTYRYSDNLQFIFHAAQNTYTLWAPVDDNVEHQGISVDWQIDEQWAAFFDYSHSHLADIPRLIATNYQTLAFDDHHNIYTRLRYKINSSTALTMEYGVFGQTFYEGSDALPSSAYSVTTFNLPTVDTEHLFRLSLDGEF